MIGDGELLIRDEPTCPYYRFIGKVAWPKSRQARLVVAFLINHLARPIVAYQELRQWMGKHYGVFGE